MNLTVHNVYFCFSEVGCTISLRDGTPCKEVPAHTPTLFVAQQPDMVCSDPAAVVKEIPNGLQLLHGLVMKEQVHAWYAPLKAELTALLDGSKFKLAWLAGKNTLVVHTDRISDELSDAVTALLKRVLPQNVEVVRKNYILPAGYTEVEYLESTGGQGISEKVSYTNNATIKAEFMMLDARESYQAVYYNCREPYCGFYAKGGDDIVLAYGTQKRLPWANTEYKSVANAIGKKITIEQRKNESFLDGTLIWTFEPAEFSGKKLLALFGENWGGSSWTAQLKGRIYSAQYWENDIAQRNFIPCLDETGAPCMFDTVTYQTFYNQCTGDFLYPTESTTYALRRELPDWGKLTPHGLRRLYHAPAGYQGELVDYALENGFKPIIEPEQPEEGYWTPRWTETEDEIVLEWVETEPPMDEPLTETE